MAYIIKTLHHYCSCQERSLKQENEGRAMERVIRIHEVWFCFSLFIGSTIKSAPRICVVSRDV